MLDTRVVIGFCLSFEYFGVSSLLHKSLNIKLYFFYEFSRQELARIKRAFYLPSLIFLSPYFFLLLGNFFEIIFAHSSILLISCLFRPLLSFLGLLIFILKFPVFFLFVIFIALLQSSHGYFVTGNFTVIFFLDLYYRS